MSEQDDVLARAAQWDRCYPGNVNPEQLVADLVREIERLREENAALRDGRNG